MDPPVRISIDGPTASGKTTLGMWLSDRLSIPFLDSGLTFRGVALGLLDRRQQPTVHEIRAFLERFQHRPYEPTKQDSPEAVLLDGVDVSHLIWSESCNAVLPWVTESAEVRQEILDFHLNLTSKRDCITAGRDVAWLRTDGGRL